MISTIVVPNRRVGVPLVMIAGICWSTSGLIYRLIEEASPWQVLFYRSLALFLMLAIWLGINYHKNFSRIFSNSIGLSLTGGVCLGVAFTTYILSLEYTSVPRNVHSSSSSFCHSITWKDNSRGENNCDYLALYDSECNRTWSHGLGRIFFGQRTR